jgi:Tol biopolymer transport system component
VRFAIAGKDSFDVSCRGKLIIPLRKWKKLLNKYQGEQMNVRVFAKKSAGWIQYLPIRFTIASEPVDSYLVYRLIEPGYEGWEEMGIYQRCIENYDETPLMVNTLTNNDCVNCHSFCRGNPQTMLFHVRQQYAGTIFVKDGKISKINTKTPGMISAGVYPRWHPGGRYVAFSTNTTRQGFHTAHTNKVEVYDKASDIVIFDVENNSVFTDSLIHSKERFETYPEWSPDGDYLYFCSAPAYQTPQQFDSLRYDLIRIAFDVSTGRFGGQTETLVSATHIGKSISLPRVSPDGRYVVFCLSDYGSFPVWHHESDLNMLDLETGAINNLAIVNSNQSDSYHSWSTNGRWLVFGSRRMDGTFTRPYISYFDANGKAYPPFLLPQKNPLFYDYSLKSYNIPEFTKGKVDVSPYQFVKAMKGKAVDAMSQ